MKYYAGIGARKAPEEALVQAAKIALALRQQGYILRSGGAKGCDSYFELSAEGDSEIFRTKDFKVGSEFVFPEWVDEEVVKHCWECDISQMRPFIAALVKRNMMQILGRHGDSPVDFVICWTPTIDPCDEKAGGTRYATRCALAHDIPIFNLKNDKHCSIIQDVILEDFDDLCF